MAAAAILDFVNLLIMVHHSMSRRVIRSCGQISTRSVKPFKSYSISPFKRFAAHYREANDLLLLLIAV
jgi:hypothetical protein